MNNTDKEHFRNLGKMELLKMWDDIIEMINRIKNV